MQTPPLHFGATLIAAYSKLKSRKYDLLTNPQDFLEEEDLQRQWEIAERRRFVRHQALLAESRFNTGSENAEKKGFTECLFRLSGLKEITAIVKMLQDLRHFGCLGETGNSVTEPDERSLVKVTTDNEALIKDLLRSFPVESNPFLRIFAFNDGNPQCVNAPPVPDAASVEKAQELILEEA